MSEVYNDSKEALASACEHLRDAVAELSLTQTTALTVKVGSATYEGRRVYDVFLDGVPAAIASFIPKEQSRIPIVNQIPKQPDGKEMPYGYFWCGRCRQAVRMRHSCPTPRRIRSQ